MTPVRIGFERWCRLGRLAALPVGGIQVVLDDLELALIRTRGDDLFLIQGDCPHHGGPLAEGEVGATAVTCPWHRWRYDLRTGRRDDREGAPIDTYPVRARDGWVEAVPEARPSARRGAQR